MKTLVIGLGNPILTDDGVGVKVAYAVEQALGSGHDDSIDVTEASVGGLRLMEMMVGYDRVILIDALTLGDAPPGSVQQMSLPDLEAISPTQHSASAHDASLVTALDSGRRMGLPLPDDIIIYAISVENVLDFSDTPTPAVARAIPRVTKAVLEDLGIDAS
ncbi:MAG TPA: hydrogenase maturation protease [Caldilineae bacterium]|nr:hydrogenase maturation protease [Caldilineae bacterium]